MDLNKLKEIGDKLSNGKITPEEAMSQLNAQAITLPSDEEIQNTGKELEKSLQPVPLSLTDNEINEILCQYEGEELANRIFWKILDKQGLFNNIKEKPDFSSNRKFDQFVIGKGLESKLNLAKEMISDNLDLSLLNIKFKGANLKKRDLKVGPFSFGVDVITNKGTPLFYHIASPKFTLDQILNKLKGKSKKTDQCVQDFNKKYNSNSSIDDQDAINIIEKLAEKEKSSVPRSIYDIVDDIFCEPDIPINPETGENLFTKEDLKLFLDDLCKPEIETPNPDPAEIPQSLNTEEISDSVNKCLDQAKDVFKDIREKNELKLRYQKVEKELEEILYHYRIIKNYYNSLYNSYIKKIAMGEEIAKKLNYTLDQVISSYRNYGYKFQDVTFWEGITQGIRDNVKKESSKVNYNPDSLHLTINAVLGSREAAVALDEIKKFSCRFKETAGYISPVSYLSSKTPASYFGIKFTFQYPHGLGESIKYNEVNIDVPNSKFSDKYQTIDTSKLKIGMEFGPNGILSQRPNDFFKNFDNYVIEKNEDPNTTTKFYDFIKLINETNLTKNQIINIIENDHGFLYSNLYEISSSSWLFFTPEERGDNDARLIKDLKPRSTADGIPNNTFTEFWSNYKLSWDKKYKSKRQLIEDRIERVKNATDVFVEKLSDYYFIINTSPIKDNTSLLKNASDEIDSRVTQIQDLLLFIAEKVGEIDQQLSPDSLSTKASQIKCGIQDSQQSLNVSCPSDCCGPAGKAIDNMGFGGVSDSPDCPNIYTVCYWKEFCKKLNIVGTLPIPNGIPPIEKPSGFLPNLSLKYWPVGYIPPAFIPLPPPAVNPLDGMPFIRIPMPFNWKAVDPIIIPLPIGLMVIFIPFIGGFMPSPLIFFHDFLTGNSIFLMGMRGFRFIPRKSDPVIKDPAESFKRMLTKGVPHYLFPFMNLGKDNVDSIERMKKEITENLLKQLSNTVKNVDFSKIQILQDEISKNKKEKEDKILEIKRKSALTGESSKELEKELKEYTDSKKSQKIKVVKDAIKDYIRKTVNLPDVLFPKQSKNLISEIPSPVKLAKNTADKIKIGTIPKPSKINLKSRILGKIKNIEIPEDPAFIEKNKNLSPDSKIVASFSVPLGEIGNNKEEFKKLSQIILNTVGNFINGKDSPINPKNLGLFNTKLNGIPKTGSQIPKPSSLNVINDPILSSLNNHISNNLSVSSRDIITVSEKASISNNKVLRDKDLKLLIKSSLNKTLKSFPSDLKNFSAPGIADPGKIAKDAGSLIGSIEAPPFPPKKSGTVAMPLGIGGIPQIPIPGKAIGSIIINAAISKLESLDLDKILPGGLDNFENLSETDIKTICLNLLVDISKSINIPLLNNIPPIPLKSRPQDMIEFSMQFLPVHPFSDIAFTLLWNLYKSPPRVPISSDVMDQYIKLQNTILSKLPWPVVIMLGRGVINILNPLDNREDLPRWDRMSLNNPLFVVFLDEFLRSAADISGGFKFFAGGPSKGLLYPLPDLEISLGFGTKIGIQ